MKERSGTVFKLKNVDTDSKEDTDEKKETETNIAVKDELLLEFDTQITEWNKDTEKLRLMTDDEKKQNEPNIVINAEKLFVEHLECTKIMNIQSERVLKASSSLMIKLVGKNDILHVKFMFFIKFVFNVY